jgi:hypothetical protein
MNTAYGCRYWDPEIQPEKYSFVDFAIARGYSIFYYDRLGVSKSSQFVISNTEMTQD